MNSVLYTYPCKLITSKVEDLVNIKKEKTQEGLPLETEDPKKGKATSGSSVYVEISSLKMNSKLKYR